MILDQSLFSVLSVFSSNKHYYIEEVCIGEVSVQAPFFLSPFLCILTPGPALYVYNNAVFTPEDWHGIQEIARSRKKDDPLKVGRFGIGFNSVYHITGVVFAFQS